MRNKAKECVLKAKELIAAGDYDSLRYACLELRFAIEYITYSLASTYKDELSTESYKNWKANQLIQAMLAIDPGADKSHQIAIGPQSHPDVAASTLRNLGEDKRFSLKWANKNYNALGNFLHAPSIEHIENNIVVSKEKIKDKVQEVLLILEEALLSPVWNVNFGTFHSFTCICGRKFKRRVESYKADDGIPCPSCKAIWDDLGQDDEGKTTFRMRETEYQCLACNKIGLIGVHQIKLGAVLVCGCGAKNQITYGTQLVEEH
jgi:DNA-directed RNA polymerase subunit RPC12/RpoP